jgi:hypothetical protein
MQHRRQLNENVVLLLAALLTMHRLWVFCACRSTSGEAATALPSAAEAAATVAAMQAERQLLQQQLKEVRPHSSTTHPCMQMLQHRFCSGVGISTALMYLAHWSSILHMPYTSIQSQYISSCFQRPSAHSSDLSSCVPACHALRLVDCRQPQLQQQQAAVEVELQARQAAADDVLQEFDRDIADPVDKVRDHSSSAQASDTDALCCSLPMSQPVICSVAEQQLTSALASHRNCTRSCS